MYRCPLWVPRRGGGLKRLLRLACFALSSLPVLLAQVLWRPDVEWVVEPPLFCAPAAWATARLCGAKAWLHVQDFEVDAAFSLGLLKGAGLRRLARAGESWLMRRFDRVSSISQRMLANARAKGVAPERLRFFPNWVGIQAASPQGVAAYRAQLQLAPGQVVALYSGTMGEKQGLEVLAELARLCQAAAQPRPDLLFVFCGSAGAGRSKLEALCQGLPNVRFLDLQPAERLADFLAMADIHLLPQRADAADLVMPSKLTGMLASARPVVATAHPETELGSVVQACGVVVAPENAQAFADAVLSLAADPGQRQALGAAGYAYAARHLERDAVLAGFEAELDELLAGGHPVDE